MASVRARARAVVSSSTGVPARAPRVEDPGTVLVGTSLRGPQLVRWLAGKLGGQTNVWIGMPGDLALLLGARSWWRPGRAEHRLWPAAHMATRTTATFNGRTPAPFSTVAHRHRRDLVCGLIREYEAASICDPYARPSAGTEGHSARESASHACAVPRPQPLGARLMTRARRGPRATHAKLSHRYEPFSVHLLPDHVRKARLWQRRTPR